MIEACGDIDLTSYYYNPNIQPKFEFNRRKETLVEFCKTFNCKLVTDDTYDIHEFARHDMNHEGFVSRCHYCYYMRLKSSFEYAKKSGFDTVMTTLSISPYQNQKLIKEVGNMLSKEYGIEYIHLDYTVKYAKGQEMAKELGLYRQKYCGCMFSMDDSFELGKKMCKLSPLPELEFKVSRSFEVRKSIEYINLLLSNEDASKEGEIIQKFNNLCMFNLPTSLKGSLDKAYILKSGDDILSTVIFKEIDKHTIELEYIETTEKSRNLGFASKIIKAMAGNYSQKYSRMIIAVTPKLSPFAIKNGFDKFLKSEDGKIYYMKDLKKNNN